MVQSFPTEDQVKSVKDWARASLLGSFNASVKTKAEKVSTTSLRLSKNLNKDKEERNTDTLENVRALDNEIKSLKKRPKTFVERLRRMKKIANLELKIADAATTKSATDDRYVVKIDPTNMEVSFFIQDAKYIDEEEKLEDGTDNPNFGKPVLNAVRKGVFNLEDAAQSIFFTPEGDFEPVDVYKREAAILNAKTNNQVNDDGL